MIFLHKPYIESNNRKSRLVFDVDIDSDKKQVWFEVDNEYGKYLCDDRVDAIFVGLLSYALREGHDIESDSFITEEILFKVEEYLIPSLVKYGKNLHNIKINIAPKSALVENAGAVGTGCSCGIDSMHAIFTKLNLQNPNFSITHLCINNVGAFNECYGEKVDVVRKTAIARAKKLARKVKLPLIITDSNFMQEIYQNHLLTNTYSSVFAILCLQKLYKKYYLGSVGLDFSGFNLKDNDMKDCAYYELLSLDCFSTHNLKIYSEGGAQSRLEKTADICQNKLVQEFLYVCTIEEHNCSKCDKCMRTILSLYALMDDLEPYRNVFDVDYFYAHKEEYFNWLYNEHLFHVKMNEPTYYKLLEKEDFKSFVEEKESENASCEEFDYYKQEYDKVIHSKAFKVGSIIMFIPQKVRKLLTKNN